MTQPVNVINEQTAQAVRLSANEILGLYNKGLHNTLCGLAQGQRYMEEAYPKAAQATGLSPKDGQKPIYAYIGPTHPYGHESFFLGPVLLGEALVGRWPLSLCMDRYGDPTPNFLRLCDLAVSKGLRYLIHSKTTASQLLQDVYDYFSLPASLRQETIDPLTGRISSPLLVGDWGEFIASRGDLYFEAKEKGLAYFERLGLVFRGDNDRENSVLAMVALQVIKDQEIAERCHLGLDVVSVIQDAWARNHYVWNGKTKHFIRVPSLDHNFDEIASYYERRARSRTNLYFLRQLPMSAADAEIIGLGLMTGYTAFLKAVEEQDMLSGYSAKDMHRSEIVYYSGCVDSRMLKEAILGPLMTGSIRLVGSIYSKPEGGLEDEASLTIATVLREDATLVHSHHSRCGAMEAIYYGNADPQGVGAKLPAAFQKLSNVRQADYARVMSRGKTDAERLAYYKERTGIQLASITDAPGLEILLTDIDNIKKAYPELKKALYVFVDISGCQIYVKEPESSRFVAIAPAPHVVYDQPAGSAPVRPADDAGAGDRSLQFLRCSTAA